MSHKQKKDNVLRYLKKDPYRETDGLILKKLALQKEATALLKGGPNPLWHRAASRIITVLYFGATQI